MSLTQCLGIERVSSWCFLPRNLRSQIRDVVGAAIQAASSGTTIESEIMIPLISTAQEFILIKELAEDIISEHEIDLSKINF